MASLGLSPGNTVIHFYLCLAPQEGKITSGQLLLLQFLGCFWQEQMLFLPSGRREVRI